MNPFKNVFRSKSKYTIFSLYMSPSEIQYGKNTQCLVCLQKQSLLIYCPTLCELPRVHPASVWKLSTWTPPIPVLKPQNGTLKSTLKKTRPFRRRTTTTTMKPTKRYVALFRRTSNPIGHPCPWSPLAARSTRHQTTVIFANDFYYNLTLHNSPKILLWLICILLNFIVLSTEREPYCNLVLIVVADLHRVLSLKLPRYIVALMSNYRYLNGTSGNIQQVQQLDLYLSNVQVTTIKSSPILPPTKRSQMILFELFSTKLRKKLTYCFLNIF